MSHTATLRDWPSAHQTLTSAAAWIKRRVLEGRPVTLTLADERRAEDQSRKFHALCRDLERARLPWAGKPRTLEQWKVLLISAHAVATKQGAEIVPGLEGEFVNLRESTSRMPKPRMSSLLEYSTAFAASAGVEMDRSAA